MNTTWKVADPKQAFDKMLKDKKMTVHPDADIFPMLSPVEIGELARDIKKNGLLEPIIAKGKEIWDGRNRLLACWTIDAKPTFKEPPAGISARDFIIGANIHRRHLTPSQRLNLVEKLVKANPEKSDRQHAATAKVSPTFVGKVRKKAEARGDVSTVDTRTDTKGRKQPASKPKVVKLAITNVPAEPKVVQAEITTEQRKAVNAELEHINSGDRKSAGALAEFKVACNTWLPKLNREHLDEAVRYCGTFATAKAEPVS
jgi:ParB-like chromosome segregation protein Spo0J